MIKHLLNTDNFATDHLHAFRSRRPSQRGILHCRRASDSAEKHPHGARTSTIRQAGGRLRERSVRNR